MLEWFGIKQILWLCSVVMSFIYNHIVSNVGVAIILYALFVHVLFIPFSIKKGFNRLNAGKVKQQRAELRKEFLSLPHVDQANEDVKKAFAKRDKAIKKKAGSAKVGCLITILKWFAIIATTPVVSNFDYYVKASPEAHKFLGLDLSAGAPGMRFTPAVLIPLFVTIILTAPGIIGVLKNIRDQKLVQAQKSKEELEEEVRLLKEMGVKEKKIPTTLVVQCVFAVLYFYLFSRLTLTVSLFWGSYYLLDIVVKGVINSVFAKISVQLHKKQREE